MGDFTAGMYGHINPDLFELALGRSFHDTDLPRSDGPVNLGDSN